MNLASEVSSLISERDSLDAEVGICRERLAALEAENAHLHAINGKLSIERDTYLRQAEAMRSILTQAGSGLVNAMNAFRAGERELQEQNLGVGHADDPPPKFIAEGGKALHAVG